MNRASMTPSLVNQRGAVLLVAIVLLLLAGVMTLFALNVGVFEQRSTANDVRAKLVNEVAEAGLAQGFEYLMRQHPDMLDDNSWEKCVTNDETFPCGAVEQFEPDGTTPRRASMYRLKAKVNSITGIDAALSNYMLPLSSDLSTVGNGEAVAYGVAPLLCRVQRPVAGEDAETPVRCGDGTGTGASDLRVATFVSVATIPNSSARTTLVQTIGQYPLLGELLEVPPLTASGVIDATGNINIVVNPNSAGPGVPVSIWTRSDVGKTGNFNTCYADEFFRQGDKFGDVKPEGPTVTCDTCECEPEFALSYPKAGNVQTEGIDVLDIDVGGHVGINHDVKPEEFPCDLFGYVFGVDAHSDEDGDFFCEKQIVTQYVNPNNTAQYVNMGADEAYLYTNAQKIAPVDGRTYSYSLTPGGAAAGTVTAASLLTDAQKFSASELAATDSWPGMVWCQENCGLDSQITFGSPDAPVVLVVDGDVDLAARVFGLLFLRSNGSADLVPADGGNAELRINNGHAAVYGAVVVQGTATKINGGVIVSDPTVLGGLGGAGNDKPATLPGAWNDQKSY